jgi:transcriptional regulator with XRE-family HTH domain
MMLQQLIRQTLSRKGMSMRQASREAGMNPNWVRDILDGKIRDPGIGSMVALADVLGIDRLGLLEAVDADHNGDRRSIEAAMRVFASMSPKERAAFIAMHRTRPPKLSVLEIILEPIQRHWIHEQAVDLVVSVRRRLQFQSARRPTAYPLRLPSWLAGA